MAELEPLAGRLHSAAIRLLRSLRRNDAVSGVGPAQLSALSVLVYGGPRSPSELAASEGVSAPTMSRIVAALERERLARRRRDPEDARRSVLTVTARGRKLLERARTARLAALQSALEELDADEVRTLAAATRILERLRLSAE